jgi:hypothetical protein
MAMSPKKSGHRIFIRNLSEIRKFTENSPDIDLSPKKSFADQIFQHLKNARGTKGRFLPHFRKLENSKSMLSVAKEEKNSPKAMMDFPDEVRDRS